MKWFLLVLLTALTLPGAALELADPITMSIVGEWRRDGGATLWVRADGTASFSGKASWRWINKRARRFEVSFVGGAGPELRRFTVAEDGLTAIGVWEGKDLEYVKVIAPAAPANPATPANIEPEAPVVESPKMPPDPRATELVKVHRSNLVFVTTPGGAGSGFIASYGTGTFLITNAHVAAGAKGATFKTLEGIEVQIGAPAVAVGHDIFLMAMQPGRAPLPVMTGVDQNASIGDEVVVLGNAEGAGVINTIGGRIVGLGPNLVEVDAPFQPGNSGSPIIHLNSGKVIGVATYLTTRKYDPATRQPVKDPVIRRFGYRLDNVKAWQPVKWPSFYAQATEMESIEKLTNDLSALLDDIGQDGRVTPGAHTNPVIKNRIDACSAASRAA